ncbi:MAG: sigma-70 family RNA polymerase sigma factor [Prevotella sp.]|nr:sigma-70 family RNA polymerase sigma factor [Prevotella sp.]
MTDKEFEHIAIMLRPELLMVGRDFFDDESIAEDIAQDVLVRLWQLRQRIGDITDIKLFAVRMTKNACIDEWRNRKLRHTEQLCEVTASENMTTAELDISDYRLMVKRMLRRLPKSEQRLFIMYHEMEMDIGQIAAVTGIGSRSISAMLSSARKKLAELLRKGGTK